MRCKQGDNVVLSPAFDGGYTLIGLSKLHRAAVRRTFPWSTDAVYRLTLDRAREIGLPVSIVPGWYDVDDAASLQMLEDELRRAACRHSPRSPAPTPRRRGAFFASGRRCSPAPRRDAVTGATIDAAAAGQSSGCRRHPMSQ